MTPKNTISCPACGGPNEPEPGKSRMACTYCGSTLTIPKSMQVPATPKVEKMPLNQKQAKVPEIEASDLLRKAQPVAIRAWNLYALWTWVRWMLPACLVIFIIGLIACAMMGALPLIWLRR